MAFSVSEHTHCERTELVGRASATVCPSTPIVSTPSSSAVRALQCGTRRLVASSGLAPGVRADRLTAFRIDPDVVWATRRNGSIQLLEMVNTAGE